MRAYEGRCHCGTIQFTVQTDLAQVMRCNCSLCGRAGTLMTFVGADAHQVLQGQDQLVDYQFGPRRTHHAFCGTCGVRPFAIGQGEHGPMVMVNVGCLDGVDTRDYAAVMVYDGAAL